MLGRVIHLLEGTGIDGLSLWSRADGGQVASAEQIDKLITNAVSASERYYPALQLVAYGNNSPKDALQVAIAEAYGRA